MTEARLAAGVEASAFLRRAEQAGGFGTVLQKGDAERGTLIIAVLERGEHQTFLERRLQVSGGYGWDRTGPAPGDSRAAIQYVAKMSRSDPDCWIVELDIPSPERFIAETISSA